MVFLVLLVFGRALEDLLVYYLPVIGNLVSRILDFRILIITPIMILIVMMAFHSLPDRKAVAGRKITFRNQLPGAILCTVVWYLFSVGVSVYVGYFNGFSMYGSLTTVVLTMFWIYFCMYILLFCAELNGFYYREIEDYWKRIRDRRRRR